MSRKAFVIFAGDGAWRVGVARCGDAALHDVAVCAEDTPEAVAERCHEALAALGHRGEGAVLALPSGWCLSAPVATQGLPTRGRRQAALYRLEERLPIPAEDFTADFVDAGDELLGVCVENKRVSALLEALEARGIVVAAVCPAVLLALEALHMCGQLQPEGVVLLADDEGTDAIRLRRGRPVVWQLLRDDRSMGSFLALEPIRSALRLPVLHLGEKLGDATSNDKGIDLTTIDDSSASLACAAAATALDGGGTLLINLRRDALGAGGTLRSVSEPLRFATVATAAALLLLTAVFLWRGQAYRGIEDRLVAEQEAVFHAALPGRPVPPSVKLALESEARRLRGVSGESAELPRQASALRVLHETLRRLPTELRFRVLEVRIEDTRVFLDGEARSHGDAELIAVGLRARGGFDVDPPRTEQLAEQGVAFTLTALASTAEQEVSP